MLLLALVGVGAVAGPPYSDQFLVDCAYNQPDCAAILALTAPPTYDVVFSTTQGGFVIHVETAWAPPMAQRFYTLSKLGYYVGGAFYRVLHINSTFQFVVQFGMRGVPAVDNAWYAMQTLNTTAPVLYPGGNVRGTVSFSTNEVVNDGTFPYCSAPICSQGFSMEIFVNLADNRRLNNNDFSPFGVVVNDGGFDVVESLYAQYGEVADLCASASKNSPPSSPPRGGAADPYCVWDAAKGAWAGVNMTALQQLGRAYLAGFPLLDTVVDMRVLG